MSKIIYQFKDQSRMYWRVECYLDTVNDNWVCTFYRSISDYKDPKAQEVYCEIHENTTGMPDIDQALNGFSQYINGVIIGMSKNLVRDQ